MFAWFSEKNYRVVVHQEINFFQENVYAEIIHLHHRPIRKHNIVCFIGWLISEYIFRFLCNLASINVRNLLTQRNVGLRLVQSSDMCSSLAELASLHASATADVQHFALVQQDQVVQHIKDLRHRRRLVHLLLLFLECAIYQHIRLQQTQLIWSYLLFDFAYIWLHKVRNLLTIRFECFELFIILNTFTLHLEVEFHFSGFEIICRISGEILFEDIPDGCEPDLRDRVRVFGTGQELLDACGSPLFA